MEPRMVPSGVGIIHTKIRVYSPDLERSEVLDLLADTGSTLTWIPEETATRLGIPPTDVARFRTGDGRTIERPVGDARIEFEGCRRPVTVVFARTGDANVLGVIAMEALTIVVDPLKQTLHMTGEYLALSVA